MKALILIIASSLLIQNFMHAQKNGVVVNEILEHMSKGEQTGLEVALVDIEAKEVIKSWKKFAKKNLKAKTKLSKKSSELFTDNAKAATLSQNTVDIYAITSKAPYGTRLAVFFDLGGDFISSQNHEIAYGAAVQLLKEFAINQSVKVVDSELKIQKNNFSDLKKELKNLIKDKDGFFKEIERAKALIAQREQDILNNEAAQETKRQQIAIQEEILKTIQQKKAGLTY